MTMSVPGMTVLVTGAAGLVGAEVVARLATAGHAVIALTHDNGHLVRNNGAPVPSAEGACLPVRGAVRRLAGDVTAPSLGLPPQRYATLASRVDLVVHCAAVTTFGLPDEVYGTVNVTGTQRVLDLAAVASAGLVHVSTAYVCGERDGVATESELDVGQRFGNPYERSKARAEALVREAAAGGQRAAVVRPSIVVGERRSGAVREFKNIYVLIRLITEGKLRTLPGHYHALVDLVPVDWAAQVVAEVADRFDAAVGATLHAVGHSLSLRDFSDVLAEYPSFEVPRFVSPNGFDAATLPPAEQPYYRRVGALYASYFRRRVRFDDTTTRTLLGRRPLTGGQAYLRRLLDHCLRVGYLGGSAARGPHRAGPTRRRRAP